MDKNSMDRLGSRLLDALKLPGDAVFVEYAMALMVLSEFINKNFAIKHNNIYKPADPFLSDAIEDGKIRPEWSSRILHLANYVFLLRNIDGFKVVRDRLMTRPLTATFYEIEAAAYMHEMGCTISIKPETGVTGQDFDFIATKDNKIYEVEVTEFTRKIYHNKSISNKLQEKEVNFLI
ncbi:hypothetical protein [Methylobacterium sp. Leaf117]|uniref:hypothetical protein n=1 Tax=Methylobacterium sp. Leaf117 TaxID=1736260 RepID=UPI000A80D0A5|nr:hypothetical protein [Methylobacterium sp. Leaf117]